MTLQRHQGVLRDPYVKTEEAAAKETSKCLRGEHTVLETALKKHTGLTAQCENSSFICPISV